ncbi:MAG: EF-P lysine aminoacylase EpmA [Gemmobacter sp.]
MPDHPDQSPWWSPRRHADRRPALIARNRTAAALRGWFEAADFTEVDPAGLVVSPGNEAHLHAFATEAIGTDGASRRLYLHTSPEFAMKKLLAAGERRIFALTHVWRNREAGGTHAAEFTMLEWYRTGEGYERLMDDTVALAQAACRAAGSRVLRRGEAVCDPFAPPERMSLAEAFARHAGIDLGASLGPDGQTDRATLAAAAVAAGVRIASDDTWSDIFSRVVVERIEPHLGQGRLSFLDRYPLAEAALARPAPDDPRYAERFEVYACGVELANGFGELTDAAEQRARFEAEMDLKARIYGERYPIDEDFLAALGAMPDAAGIALGFDRLVMLATAAPRIEDVLWTPPGR